ncbi:MAG: glycosyltransferase, partial [Methylococcales bacterium]|nr:glycosyltransferase [Methylococcales bacterium]
GIVAGGAKNNFAHLLRHSRGEYIMFCDQDDIWLPSKIELTLSAMIGTEREMGKNAPVVVFSDVKVVDSNLALIAESGWHYQRNGPQFCKELGLLAVRNCITGCTMMINRAALAISSPLPREAIMHDWWIGLSVLKNGGCLIPLDAKTILYRQHDGNVIGVAKYNSNYFIRRTLGFTQTIQELFDVYLMAKRVGAVKSWIDFIKFKISAFSQVIAKK